MVFLLSALLWKKRRRLNNNNERIPFKFFQTSPFIAHILHVLWTTMYKLYMYTDILNKMLCLYHVWADTFTRSVFFALVRHKCWLGLFDSLGDFKWRPGWRFLVRHTVHCGSGSYLDFRAPSLVQILSNKTKSMMLHFQTGIFQYLVNAYIFVFIICKLIDKS